MSKLTDRILELLPDARLAQEVDNDDKEALILGPPGCLGGNVLVETDEGKVPIRNLAGKYFMVSSLGPNGRQFSPAFGFAKGVEPLYRLSWSGGELLATASHRVLAARDGLVGWKATSEVGPGDELLSSEAFQSQTNWVFAPSVRCEDDPHLNRTVRDWTDGCLTWGGACDEHFPMEAMGARVSVPSRVDVHERTRDGSRLDDLVPELGCTPTYPVSGRPSMPDSYYQNGHRELRSEARSRQSVVSPSEASHPAPMRPHSESDQIQARLEDGQWVRLDELVHDAAWRTLRINSVHREPADTFYDMVIVEGWPVYEAAGSWHHNTGKTRSLGVLLDAHLRAGLPANQFLVATFARNATKEIRGRLASQFRLTEQDMRWVRTIHATCFNLLKLDSAEVVQASLLKEFGEATGYRFQGVLNQRSVDDPYATGACVTLADWCYIAEELRRASLRSVEENHAVLTGRNPTGEHWSLEMAQTFSKRYGDWKKEFQVVDFMDMLELVKEFQVRPSIQWMFLDEAQDQTPLQWAVVDMWAQQATRLFVGADDDQCIHSWNGASPKELWDRNAHRIVLSRSYRLPETVHAAANTIISRVSQRVEKQFNPHRPGGAVHKVFDWSGLTGLEQGSWFLLVRNRAFAGGPREMLMERGIPFLDRTSDLGIPGPDSPRGAALAVLLQLHAGLSVPSGKIRLLQRQVYPARWLKEKTEFGRQYALVDLVLAGAEPDLVAEIREKPLSGLRLESNLREYLERVLRLHGPSALVEKPRIVISTIHGAKGEEADKVAISTSMTRRTRQEYEDNPDGENRVYYVAVTRARDEVIWVFDGPGFEV